jgi:hypothetical protein
MKNKALFVFFFGIILSLIITTDSFAWPLVFTPEMEGTISDTINGQPIQNVILTVEWVNSIYAVVDRGHEVAQTLLIATDKNGKYKIPAKTMFQPLGGFFSKFDRMEITVLHPLYAKVWEPIYGSAKTKMKVNEHNFQLFSLGEKYKNSRISKTGNNNIFEDIMFIQLYAEQAKKIHLELNWDKYFAIWEHIIEPYKSEVDISFIEQRIKEIEKRSN